MNKTITFNELRKIKDSLPSGSMQRIADELGLSVETVRNFFGGQNEENSIFDYLCSSSLRFALH